MSELKEVEFYIEYQDKPTQFRMREMLGENDEALIMQCTKPDGNIDTANLWIERLSRSIIEPSVNKTTLRQFTRKQLSLVKAKWLALNEATERDFLEAPKATAQSESAT